MSATSEKTGPSEALQAAIDAGDGDAVVALFAPLNERERRALAPIASAALTREELARKTFAGNARDPQIDVVLARCTAATLAVFATGTLANVRACIWWDGRVGDVLRARRPPWLAEFAQMDGVPANRQEYTLDRLWLVVRDLRRAGVVERSVSEGATLGLMLQARAFASGALALLEADAELLEADVWDLFLYEGTSQISLTAVDKYTRHDHQWSRAFIELCARGALPRGRVLDATLDVLERDWIQFRAGWFSRVHEALQPTLEERTARASRYVRLLASRIAPTVSFAMHALTTLAAENATLPNETLLALAHAYRATGKGTALDALELAQRLLEARSDAAANASDLTAALEHASLDVQKRALELIERYADASDAAFAERMFALRDTVAPSLRARVRTLARAASANVGTLEDETYRTKAAPTVASESTTATRSISDPARIEPIEDIETLVEAGAAALEGDTSPVEIERVLDGVSRLCAQRPSHFERFTGPLRKRAARMREQNSYNVSPVRRLIATLLDAWLTSEYARPLVLPQTRVEAFVVARIDELCARVATAQPAPLLAAPTSNSCTIDPRTLVARFASLTRDEARSAHGAAAIPRYDAIAAMLRIERAHRNEARDAALNLPGEFGIALRYALGADDVAVGTDAALWIAASRCRDANADDANVEAMHPGFGAGATRAATISFTWTIEEFTYKSSPDAPQKTMRVPKPIVAIDPPAIARAADDMPSVNTFIAVRETNPISDPRPIDLVRCLGTVWAADRESWFARGCCELASNLDWRVAKWSDRAYLEPLLERDIVIGPAARILLALGLLAKDSSQGVLAVDAVTAALDDERLDATMLEALLHDIMTWAPYTQTKRAIPRLAAIANASKIHAARVGAAIDATTSRATALKPATSRAFRELGEQLASIVSEDA